METAKGYILLTVRFEREDNRWTAECLELGTASFGDTHEEAEETITEAIQLHLDGLEEHGERERFFRENNIAVYPVPPTKEPPVKHVTLRPGSVIRYDYREWVPV